jgi:hypothetical protein
LFSYYYVVYCFPGGFRVSPSLAYTGCPGASCRNIKKYVLDEQTAPGNEAGRRIIRKGNKTIAKGMY